MRDKDSAKSELSQKKKYTHLNYVYVVLKCQEQDT